MLLRYTVGKVSSKVAHDMAQVAKASDELSTLELNDRLLDTLRNSLKVMAPDLRKISIYAYGKSTDIARLLAVQIKQNQELSDALASRRKVAPRFIGALVLGITQIVTDFTKMVLTRY